MFSLLLGSILIALGIVIIAFNQSLMVVGISLAIVGAVLLLKNVINYLSRSETVSRFDKIHDPYLEEEE